MAKSKKRKEIKKESNGFKLELVGLLLVIISLIGFIPNTGVVGNFISNFSMFMVGTWYNLFLFAIMVVGLYMMIKRDKPDFFTSKLVGVYVFIIGILLLSHVNYIQDTNLEGFDIVTETVNNFMVSSSSKMNLGGGILGAMFSSLFVYLFDLNGTIITTWALLICGIIMFTGVSIYDVIKKMTSRVSENFKKDRVNDTKKHIKKAEEKFENDNKIVINSVEELIHINEEKHEKPNIIKEEKEEKHEKIEKNEITDKFIEDTKGYNYPPLSLLSKPPKNKNGENRDAINKNVSVLQTVFHDFGLEGKVVAINPGPTVTQYEMEIKSGTKVSKVLSINKEIALALAAKDVRIQAPIPGKSTIGIEIPNLVTEMVTVREILETVPKSMDESKLLVTLGKNIMGKPIYCEINKTPHLLVAGSTGSGKSVCINSIIVSILMRAKPDEVKLVLVDPKKVELSMYNGVPHLLTPVVTEPKKANIALKKMVVEMENRYEMFSNTGTKNIAGYNAYVEKKNENLGDGDKIRKLPFIVIIIDELADLMLVAAKEVEDSIMRITQMARAAGIHLIVATQRPSTDVITGVVKANIPCRISFAVTNGIDSRTILDATGAEKLLGKGDMLFLPQGENTAIRIQGTFLSDDEIKAVADHTIKQQIAKYDETFLMDEEEIGATTMVNSNDDDYEEPLYNEIVEFVVTQGKASASLLQRRFRLGYNRAARCIDLLEERGIVGPNNGSKPREVLVKLGKEDDE
ncbi:MAG: DNA translocase FtsK [Bacilli bacterium]